MTVESKKTAGGSGGSGNRKKKEMTTVKMMMEKKKRGERRYINSDVVCEMLSRLPYKPLARARSACKLWNSLTRDPQFLQICRRRRLNSSPPFFLVFSNPSPFSSCSTTTTVNAYQIDRDCFTLKKAVASIPACYESVVPSSCGLVCIRGGGLSGKKIAVFNPTTNEFLLLPDLPHPLLAFKIPYENRHDNPIPVPAGVDVHDGSRDTRIINTIGFGYHPPTNQYKVALLLRDPAGRIGRCYVLTVSSSPASSGGWRTVNESLGCVANIFGKPACVDGILYWQNFGHVGKKVRIISFDLGTEKLRLDTAPWTYELPHPSQPTRHLTALDGRLCFVKTEVLGSRSSERLLQMEIWRFNSDSSDGNNIGNLKFWAHVHTLELGPCPSSPPFIAYFPLYIDWCNNQILLFNHIFFIRGSVYSYNLQDKSLKVYDDVDELHHNGSRDPRDNDYPLIDWIMSTESVILHAEAFVSLD